jgi:hypothetical protein
MRLDDYHRIARQVKAAAKTCAWCRTHPGETHFDAHGYPLYDLQHHAGRYVSAAESDRISRDGP